TKFQIIDVKSNGTHVVLHPETDADHVVAGTAKEVPTKTKIADWNARSSELVSARKGKTTMSAKIDEIDLKLTPAKLIEAVKTVDGAGSGLDADTIDGINVSDTVVSNKSMWTSAKTTEELDKRVKSTDVTSEAQPNKILKLNSNRLLPTGITGNAATASSLINKVGIALSGDVTGEFQIKGDESTSINVPIVVKDDSHTHSSILTRGVAITVDDEVKTTSNLWSADKVFKEIAAQVKDEVVLDEQEQEISLGSLIKVKYGKVDMSNTNGANITFKTPFVAKVLFDGFSVETADQNIPVVTKPIDSLTVNGASYNYGAMSTAGTLTWFVVGI
ncbi:MAG: hypothetical protein RR409_21160, partial [Clostridium sp.]